VDIVPEAVGCCLNKTVFFAAWVVIAEDKEDVRIVYT